MAEKEDLDLIIKAIKTAYAQHDTVACNNCVKQLEDFITVAITKNDNAQWNLTLDYGFDFLHAENDGNAIHGILDDDDGVIQPVRDQIQPVVGDGGVIQPVVGDGGVIQPVLGDESLIQPVAEDQTQRQQGRKRDGENPSLRASMRKRKKTLAKKESIKQRVDNPEQEVEEDTKDPEYTVERNEDSEEDSEYSEEEDED